MHDIFNNARTTLRINILTGNVSTLLWDTCEMGYTSRGQRRKRRRRSTCGWLPALILLLLVYVFINFVISKRNKKKKKFKDSKIGWLEFVWDHKIFPTIKEKKLFIVYYEFYIWWSSSFVVVFGWGFYCEMKTNK